MTKIKNTPATPNPKNVATLHALCVDVAKYSDDALKASFIAHKWETLLASLTAHRALGAFIAGTIVPALQAVDAKVGTSGKTILAEVAKPSAGFYLSDADRETLPSGATIDRALDVHKYVSAQWATDLSVRAMAAPSTAPVVSPGIADVIALARVLVGNVRPKATSTIDYARTRRTTRLIRKPVAPGTPGDKVVTSADRPEWMPATDADAETLSEITARYDVSDVDVSDLLTLAASCVAAYMLAQRETVNA